MRKRNIPVPVSRRWVVFATVVAIAGLSASLVNAASVFMWVADGTSVQGYYTNGTSVGASANLACSGDCFSLATSGSNGTSEDLFVANSGSHTLSEYSWNGTVLKSAGPSFTFASDPTSGSISPQEIAIDGSGNLWTTSLDGQIVEYNGTTGNSTAVECPTATNCTLAGARGIMIDGTTAYVTVEGGYGLNSSVYSFPTSTGVLTLYRNVVATTVGGQENGQMRGITYDSNGDIFYADSTWAPNGTNEGYIDKDISSTAVISSLAGPNELEIGDASSGGCTDLYVVTYYGGNVTEYSDGHGGGCGSVGTLEATYLTGLVNPSGIALSPNEGGLGGDSVGVGPTFISDPVTASPEPGTLALMIGSLLLAALGIGIRVQRRRRLQ
jgi:hypothetical protein